jgi:hypothetical protein
MPDVLYVGSFENGKRHGLGQVLTSRGEAYQGPFDEDDMWGPGEASTPCLALLQHAACVSGCHYWSTVATSAHCSSASAAWRSFCVWQASAGRHQSFASTCSCPCPAGCYVFPKPAALEGAAAARVMLKFEGMFNGRPQGKGALFWQDGEEVGRQLA